AGFRCACALPASLMSRRVATGAGKHDDRRAKADMRRRSERGVRGAPRSEATNAPRDNVLARIARRSRARCGLVGTRFATARRMRLRPPLCLLFIFALPSCGDDAFGLAGANHKTRDAGLIPTTPDGSAFVPGGRDPVSHGA